MIIIEGNNMGHAQAPYTSPNVKVVNINVQGMVCQSMNSISDYNALDDDSENWK